MCRAADLSVGLDVDAHFVTNFAEAHAKHRKARLTSSRGGIIAAPSVSAGIRRFVPMRGGRERICADVPRG
jgi:hypothetical protein